MRFLVVALALACGGEFQQSLETTDSRQERAVAFAEAAQAAAHRAKTRERATDAQYGRTSSAVLRGYASLPTNVDQASPEGRVRLAVAAGDVSEAEEALAEWIMAGAAAEAVREARAAINVLRASSRRVAMYRDARWLQGHATDGGVDVVMFWELWCGPCRRHMPEVQALAERYGSRTEVVGLTTLSKGTHPEAARRYLRNERLGFPNAVIPTSTRSAVGVDGVPYAMILKDSRIVWQGHPELLTPHVVEMALR